MDENAGRTLDLRDAYEKLVDGLKEAADCAYRLGRGDPFASEAKMHGRFIACMREAEIAARLIAVHRGEKKWLSVAGKLGKMVEASNRSANLTMMHTAAGVKNSPRGPLWVKLAEGLAVIAADCFHATKQRGTNDLILGGMEYVH